MSAQASQHGPFKPWTGEYLSHRQAFLERTVADHALLERFAPDGAAPLPEGYGRGLDERCVEYPWALAALDACGRRVLDAGSALNHPWLLDRPVLRHKELTVLTLAPEPFNGLDRGVSHVFADLRDTPLRDGWFDAVVCLSTLEHIGFDNAHYGGSAGRDPACRTAFLPAMAELRRLLRPGGRLLLSVPFGAYEDLGMAQQFDAPLLDRAVEAFAPSALRAEFFRLTRDGWTRAAREECSQARYVRWAIDFFVDPAGFDLASALTESDHAAAARAVACLSLVK